ncbi:MAG TPA: peptidoglycan editing factor PgeF [Mycobacteriales bacterium]|nr:peptidoglycan editing factor PgeF [Mycobacteriales bacterium]
MTGIELIDAELPAGVVGGFTTRGGGVSPPPWAELNLALHVTDRRSRVLTNRDRLGCEIGIGRVGFPQQVHGARVLVVDRKAAGRRQLTRRAGAAGVDALVTAAHEAPIGVLVADCMPVLIADPVAGVVAAAHAGRKGLVAGVLQATIEAMTTLGAEPGRMAAVVGPSICGRCYEVPEQMRDEVSAQLPASFAQTRAGTAALDLPAGATSVIRAEGVNDVRFVGLCTAEDERFYSYRRDGVTGRFAGVIMLEPDVHR